MECKNNVPPGGAKHREKGFEMHITYSSGRMAGIDVAEESLKQDRVSTLLAWQEGGLQARHIALLSVDRENRADPRWKEWDRGFVDGFNVVCEESA